MKKPLKDWGVIRFLTKKIPNAAGDIIGEVADVVLRGESPVKAIADLLIGDNNIKLSPEDLEKAVELARLDYEREQSYLEDIQSARSMQSQIAVSRESTKLSKNFIYYFAMGVSALMFLIILLLFFVEIPTDNKRIIDILLGAFVTILSSIGAYFYGSSTGSKNKESALTGIIQSMKGKLGG